MAYQQGYGQQQPYGNNPYGNQGNPYSETSYNQAGNPYETANPYSSAQYDARPPAQHVGSSRYDDERAQGGYEMSNVSTANGNDPNRLLNQCRAIDAELDQLESSQNNLVRLQNIYLEDTDTSERSSSKLAVDSASEELLSHYRILVDRMKRIKSDKESGNPRNSATVGRVDRKVKTSMQRFQQLDSQYNQKIRQRMEREYRIVRPDASDAEVREAVEAPAGTQIFSQALLDSDRRGNANTVASAVRQRHNEIQKIERDMVQLAAMFQDLDALVVTQEAQIQHIDQRGEEVKTDANDANVQLTQAVKSAAAARRKKWICLGIAVLIVIIIVVVVVVVVEVTKK